MLPPDFAAFSFTPGPAGGDAALAERTAAACRASGATIVAVAGAQRWGLLAAVARTGLRVVAFDASRAVLAQARDALALAGLGGVATLFVTDPRDAEFADEIHAALVPSAMWRMLLTAESQRRALVSLRRALSGPSLLLLDVDRPPPLADGARTDLGERPGRTLWAAERRGPVVRVTCGAPRAASISLDLEGGSPEDAIRLASAAGFTRTEPFDADDGSPLGPSSARMWLVARKETA